MAPRWKDSTTRPRVSSKRASKRGMLIVLHSAGGAVMADVIVKQAVAQPLGKVFLAGGGRSVAAEQAFDEFFGGIGRGVAGVQVFPFVVQVLAGFELGFDGG